MRLISAVSVVLAGALAARAEWPQFRGPDGGGQSSASGLPIHWNSSENVAWKTAVEGLGWSSPVVHQNRIYVTTAKRAGEGEESLCLVCLDSRTGAELWSKEIFRQSGSVAMHKKKAPDWVSELGFDMDSGMQASIAGDDEGTGADQEGHEEGGEEEEKECDEVVDEKALRVGDEMHVIPAPKAKAPAKAATKAPCIS